MKLFLMRHAEAKEANHINDIFRELTSKGIGEAEYAAQFLKKSHIDKMLVSSAKRTMQTAEIIQKRLNCPKFEVLPELYASSENKILQLISSQDNDDKTILVIAHNPGIFNTALKLVNPDSAEYDELITNGMPSAKIVTLNFPELKNWSDI